MRCISDMLRKDFIGKDFIGKGLKAVYQMFKACRPCEFVWPAQVLAAFLRNPGSRQQRAVRQLPDRKMVC